MTSKRQGLIVLPANQLVQVVSNLLELWNNMPEEHNHQAYWKYRSYRTAAISLLHSSKSYLIRLSFIRAIAPNAEDTHRKTPGYANTQVDINAIPAYSEVEREPTVNELSGSEVGLNKGVRIIGDGGWVKVALNGMEATLSRWFHWNKTFSRRTFLGKITGG